MASAGVDHVARADSFLLCELQSPASVVEKLDFLDRSLLAHFGAVLGRMIEQHLVEFRARHLVGGLGLGAVSRP